MVASIEFIEKVIDNYGRAFQANVETAAREGNIVELKSAHADEILIAGDMHGNRPVFNAIRRIANLAKTPRRHLVLQEVCHGGPVYPTSGGCMSHQMLEDVAKLKAEFPDQVHFLMSNHELAELIDYPIVKNQKMLNLVFRLGMQEMYGAAIDKVREAYMPFIRTLPLAVRVEEGIWISHTLTEHIDRGGFSVTLFDKELTLDTLGEDSPAFNFVWGRDFRQENADAFARLVDCDVMIHGHEPCPEGFAVPNSRQIILDSHGDSACYMLIPVGQRLTQEDVLKCIKKVK